MGDDFNDVFDDELGMIRAMRASLQVPSDVRDRYHNHCRLVAAFKHAEATGATCAVIAVPRGSWMLVERPEDWLHGVGELCGAQRLHVDHGNTPYLIKKF